MSRPAALTPQPPRAPAGGPPEEASIPECFEAVAAAQPERLAIATRQDRLTYGDLNRLANRIAHAILAERGPAPEPLVLLLPSGMPMVAAMLGALKAGKTYVPIDPALPGARASYVLEDAGAPAILADGQTLALAHSLAGGGHAVLDLDVRTRGAAETDPGVPVPADAPVWILYTSGSTGRPKGVVQTHRNVLHFVGTYLGGLAVTPEDQLALLFSCAVNAGCHEIWTALLGGAVLAERLGPEQPLWAFQARGLDGRQAPLSRVEGMAEAYLEELAVGCSPGDRMPWPATASARWWPSRWPGSSRPAGRWWRSWP